MPFPFPSFFFCNLSIIKKNIFHLVVHLPFFEGRIFSCYTIQKWKPNPAVFLLAAETMGFKPEECVIIEDSIHGVENAKEDAALIVHASCLMPAGTATEGKLLQCNQHKVLQYAVPNAKTEGKLNDKSQSPDHDLRPGEVHSGFQNNQLEC